MTELIMQIEQAPTERPCQRPAPQEMNGLRLLALARIPRCEECPVRKALVASHKGTRPAWKPMPATPSYCGHQVCAPLVHRNEPSVA